MYTEGGACGGNRDRLIVWKALFVNDSERGIMDFQQSAVPGVVLVRVVVPLCLAGDACGGS